MAYTSYGLTFVPKNVYWWTKPPLPTPPPLFEASLHWCGAAVMDLEAEMRLTELWTGDHECLDSFGCGRVSRGRSLAALTVNLVLLQTPWSRWTGAPRNATS